MPNLKLKTFLVVSKKKKKKKQKKKKLITDHFLKFIVKNYGRKFFLLYYVK